jgi:hypothetical protein
MMDSSELTPTFAEDDTQYRRPLAPVITLDGDTAILLTQCDLEKDILGTNARLQSLVGVQTAVSRLSGTRNISLRYMQWVEQDSRASRELLESVP